jgi:hypothetical protein
MAHQVIMDVALGAVKLSVDRKMPMADSVMLATAQRHGSPLDSGRALGRRPGGSVQEEQLTVLLYELPWGHVSEKLVGMDRNGWTASIGFDGRHGPDYA